MFKNKKYILQTLLIICLPASLIYAAPRYNKRQNNGFSWESTQLSLEYEFGVFPYAYMTPTYKFKIRGTRAPIKTKFNHNLKMLAGYSFAISEKRRIGFEAGIGYGFSRVTRIPEFEITFTENHLKLPLLISISKVYDVSFYFAHSFMLGYEFNIILTSDYKQSGDYYELPVSMQGDQNVKKSVTNFSRLSGSIITGNRADFPKGIYAELRMELPIELFKLIPSLDNDDFGKDIELDTTFVNLMRLINANYFQLNVGVNIMEWLYPKENLQTRGKRNR
ncbi:MAG: hypothetical protein ACYC2U_00310 [Candidatus Amoebophilus sp.]